MCTVTSDKRSPSDSSVGQILTRAVYRVCSESFLTDTDQHPQVPNAGGSPSAIPLGPENGTRPPSERAGLAGVRCGLLTLQTQDGHVSRGCAGGNRIRHARTTGEGSLCRITPPNEAHGFIFWTW